MLPKTREAKKATMSKHALIFKKNMSNRGKTRFFQNLDVRIGY